MTRSIGRNVLLIMVCGFVGAAGTLPQAAWAGEVPQFLPVQMPYEPPPKSAPVPDSSVPPNTKQLTQEELQRAEALIPLLEGKQEFWAMGEFVHQGESVVPVLAKALAMPSPRIRYNAIETMAMLKATSAVPSLIQSARDANEISRIREHALRVAIRLDAAQAPPALEAMARDPNPSIRKAAAFESRYVRHKEVVPVLIDLIADEERFVAMSAIHSLWILTRHESESHDWDASSKQDRKDWSQEWVEWWAANKDAFEIPDPRKAKSSSKS